MHGLDFWLDGEQRQETNALAGRCLYLISESDLGPCKIGIGTLGSLKQRLHNFQTGNSHRITAHTFWTCQYVPDVERRIHERLKARRVRGEWFAITPNEAESAIDAVFAERCGP